MRVLFLSAITIFISVLFIKCSKNEVNAPVQRLSTISFYSEIFTNPLSQFQLAYEGDRIVKVGNSTFTYLSNGKVDKEIERIGENNSEFVSDTKEFDFTYQYLYNAQGQLIEIKLLTAFDAFIHPSSIAYQPNRKFKYFNNLLIQIESTLVNNPSSKTTFNYIYSNGILDSVKVIYANGNSGQPFQSLEDYNPWQNASDMYPNTFDNISRNNGEESYKVTLSNLSNVWLNAFKSLGFIPYRLHLYAFETSQLSHALDSYTLSNPIIGPKLIDSSNYGNKWIFAYDINEKEILKSMRVVAEPIRKATNMNIMLNYDTK